MKGDHLTKILITGVAGFVGSHMLEHLLINTEATILGIDSLEHRGRLERLRQVLARDPSWRGRFKFFKYDLAEPNTTDVLSETFILDLRPNWIINLASESHVDRSITDPAPFVKNNFNLMVNMLEFARRIKFGSLMGDRFIQVSTDEVFGPTVGKHGWREWDRTLPSNPYSASKAAQESLAISYWRTYQLPLIITNCMNMIGEMQDVEKFIPQIVKRVLAGEVVKVHAKGKEIGSRHYLHARNYAAAVLFILENLGNPVSYPISQYPDRYNIAGNAHLDNLKLARQVASILKKPLHYELVDEHSGRPGHDLHYGLDGSRLVHLGFVAPFEFTKSLKLTVKNYLDHPEWLK